MARIFKTDVHARKRAADLGRKDGFGVWVNLRVVATDLAERQMGSHHDMPGGYRSMVGDDASGLPLNCTTMLEDMASIARNRLRQTGHILRWVKLCLIFKVHSSQDVEGKTRFTHHPGSKPKSLCDL